jgi:hypothetical protein
LAARCPRVRCRPGGRRSGGEPSRGGGRRAPSWYAVMEEKAAHAHKKHATRSCRQSFSCGNSGALRMNLFGVSSEFKVSIAAQRGPRAIFRAPTVPNFDIWARNPPRHRHESPVCGDVDFYALTILLLLDPVEFARSLGFAEVRRVKNLPEPCEIFSRLRRIVLFWRR